MRTKKAMGTSALRTSKSSDFSTHSFRYAAVRQSLLLLLDSFEMTQTQEVLRFYPALPMTERVAAHDTVIPLSKPLINTLGDAITEVHVPKGQHIVVALASFNR